MPALRCKAFPAEVGVVAVGAAAEAALVADAVAEAALAADVEAALAADVAAGAASVAGSAEVDAVAVGAGGQAGFSRVSDRRADAASSTSGANLFAAGGACITEPKIA